MRMDVTDTTDGSVEIASENFAYRYPVVSCNRTQTLASVSHASRILPQGGAR